MTWLKYITDTSRNSRVQYIRYMDEYIPKLQIHQHSLLTRKVFSRPNLSVQVFFSVSSRSSSSSHHLQVIFIFRSSLSSIHLHLQFIFIFKSSSSGYGSSLDLDHPHWIWIIITGSRSSLDLDHHWWIIMDVISWFFSSQEVLQSQPFFMLVVGLASM